MKLFKYTIIMIVLSGFLFSVKRIQLIQVYSFDSMTSYPTDIVGSPDGTIYVLDGMNNRILVIDEKFNTSFIVPNNNTINQSVGIGYDNGIWIADTPRNRLCKINRNGDFEEVISLNKNNEPVDIIFTKSKIIFSDKKNHDIGIINKITKQIKKLGGKGKELGSFSFPGPMVIIDNNFIVSDILNGRVIGNSIDYSLNFLVAEFGTEEGKVFRPKGLTIDKYKNIWIADSYTGLIQIFSTDGSYVGIASNNGNKINFNTPTGIWIDQLSRIWIVESMINKISVWKIENE